MEAKTEWKMGKGGGGTHSSPTAFCLGISAPHHPEFCLGMGGDTKVFYHHRSDYGRFKIPSFTSPGHTHSPVCVPMATLFSAGLWVINPLSSS